MKNIKIKPLLYGGGQEHDLRSGTENVVGIVAIGKAFELSKKELKQSAKNISKLRDYFIEQLETKISNIKINGSRIHRLPGIVNVSFEGINGESLLLLLNTQGIYVSSASACSSASLAPSHVISAIGVDDILSYGTIRFSLGKFNTVEDIDYIMDILPNTVERLRSMGIHT